MKKNNIFGLLISGIIGLLAMSSCSVEPEFYSETVPETFFTTQDAVWQRFNRPFTHWRWYAGHNAAYWMLQELGTDEICIPTRGSDWYNGGNFQRHHHHEYDDHMSWISDGWKNFAMGQALAWDALESLKDVDFDALGFPQGTRESMIAQQQILVAYFTLCGLDLFGGVPLYTTTKSEVRGRSTAEQTFNYTDSLIAEALPALDAKDVLGAMETNVVHKAVAAALRARLYFGAQVYIGKDMYAECAQVCQDIIDGKYGKYDIDPDWTNVFGFFNETSPEIIWTVPSENVQNETDGTFWSYMAHYNYKNYLGGLEGSGSNNGCGLCPSRDPQGRLYSETMGWKLGGAFEKFEDSDIRKQNYVYDGKGKYHGMFIVGELINPRNPDWKCMGGREYKKKVITMRDQVARFSEVGEGKKYASINDLPSSIATAEENSCVRVTKRCPRPTQDEVQYKGNPDCPVIRLAEIYYMLAECKMRAGKKDEAANLINKIRARYFVGGNDPNPVTAANLDKWRMLDEWMIEFLCEGRRRIDLIRWDCYIQEDWWDHKATNDTHLLLYPIHYSITGANNKLVQNPGY